MVMQEHPFHALQISALGVCPSLTPAKAAEGKNDELYCDASILGKKLGNKTFPSFSLPGVLHQR